MTAQPHPAAPVERLHRPTPEAFRSAFLNRRKPVIITGLVETWDAFEAWSPEYLQETVGDQRVTVDVSTDGNFKPDPGSSIEAMPTEEMSVRDYVAWLVGPRDSGKSYYLTQQSLLGRFRALLDDVAIPDLFPRQDLKEANLWIGAGGNTSPLHCDFMNNLLAQVRGRKRILLFAPGEHGNLYPFPPWHSLPSHLSRVDADRPDLGRYPRFTRAQRYECVLETGEILFIPVYWWHQVTGEGLNVSINFWWKTPWLQRVAPPAYMLRSTTHTVISGCRALLPG